MANLLIVDDEEMLLSAMEIILSEAGHEVRAVSSAFEALDAIEDQRPDLVIADVMMPRMSGLQLFEATRTTEESDVPFMFVTANVAPDIRKEFARPDIVSVLYKPFDADQLARTVDDVLQMIQQIN